MGSFDAFSAGFGACSLRSGTVLWGALGRVTRGLDGIIGEALWKGVRGTIGGGLAASGLPSAGRFAGRWNIGKEIGGSSLNKLTGDMVYIDAEGSSHDARFGGG